ncbi:MAG: asparaginase [Planctomycetes bacterium]|nr:asparaginase [Planctomycetota bacterium]
MNSRSQEQARTSPAAPSYPDNPVLVRLWRGSEVESQHRGAWVFTDADGGVLDGAGAFETPYFTRSSVKCLQALPLLESGAAERFGYGSREIALAISSHNAEEIHTSCVAGMLAREGLQAQHLLCGPQPPGDPKARADLARRGEKPGAIHNNCSGKHAGFLALALQLGLAPEQYLEPRAPAQAAVRRAVCELSGVDEDALGWAIDGCSAPTFRMPLTALARAFARVSSPAGLAPPRRAACERMLEAVAAHPELIAGNHKRICTDIARVTRGRLFPKLGGEAIYAIGIRGKERALALKIDDGGYRALHATLVGLLRRLELASAEELAALQAWEERRLFNWAGLDVGHTEALV